MAEKVSKPAAKRKGRPVGGSTYSVEMRAALVQAIRNADKTGRARADVYEQFAKDWTKQLGREIPVGNVARTYQNYKDKFTKDGEKVASKPRKARRKRGVVQRKPRQRAASRASAAKAEASSVSGIEQAVAMLSSAALEVVSLQDRIKALQAEVAAANKRVRDLEARMERVRKAAG